MARTVFFSFHYQRDIMRVQVVKNHYVTKGHYAAAGYFDGSLEEKAKKEGQQVVKRLIDDGLVGSSVTCVLIGKETSARHWVYYEILKSVALGMGVFGIRIDQIGDPKQGKDTAGSSPFEYPAFGTKQGDEKLYPMIKYTSGWKEAPHLEAIGRSAALYLPRAGGVILNNLFTVYDWANNDGYDNFSKWVETAAKQAGR
jgi:hypothetical protein